MRDNEVFGEEVVETKYDSFGKYFDDAKAYEELCFNLPELPDETNPDEVHEKSKNKKFCNENDKIEVEFFDDKKEENNAEFFDDNSKASEKEDFENPGNFIPHQSEDFDEKNDFEDKKEFVKWFEAQFEIDKMKPTVASDEPPVRNIFNQTIFNQETVDKEYMQLFHTNNPSHQRLDSNKVPQLMCFL